MKKQSQNMLGVAAFIAMPESIEEFNSFIVGRPETALDFANAEAYYRGIAPKVRSVFLKAVEEATGIKPRVVSTRKGGEGKPDIDVTEKDTHYIKNVFAQGHDAASLVPLLQKAFDTVGWDMTSTRSSGPNAKDREVAEFILNAIASGESSVERVKGNYERLNPGLEITVDENGNITVETLAEAARVDRLRRDAERMTGVL